MSTKTLVPKKKLFAHPNGGKLTWEIAGFFPPQGHWSEERYLELDDTLGDRPRLELANGCLEVLPVPIEPHEFIMVFMFRLLDAFTRAHAPGLVMPSGTKIRLRPRKRRGAADFRLPDVLYLAKENFHLRHREYWDGADLVVEVVSGGSKDRRRDLVTKVKEYAAAGIREYWIIEPRKRFVRVYTLEGKKY